MENTFGIKDLFLFALIAILIVIVSLGMWQFDRQWDDVQTILKQNQTLAEDVKRLDRRLGDMAAGVMLAPNPNGDGSATSAVGDQVGKGRDGSSNPFYLLEDAKKNEDYARGGWYIGNFGTKVGKLTPLIATDVYQSYIQLLTMESLAQRDPYTLEFLPSVARTWEISDDGLKMTFHLRKDVTFSDGEPLTADDVIFTFDWVMNPDVDASRVRAYMTQLKSKEDGGWKKLDDYTVEFNFNEVYFKNFETVAGLSIMPKHFYENYTPAEFNDSVGLLMGSGPYMLENATNWTPGNGVTIIRNPRYWGEPSPLDRIVYKEIEEEAAEAVMYGNNRRELDSIGVSPEMFRKLTGDTRIMAFSNAMEYRSSFGGYTYIGWNQSRKVNGGDTPTKFSDKRVRQALTMLINRQGIADQIYLGKYLVADGPFAPGGKQDNPDITAWPYDPTRAKELLAEVGYEDRDNDGVLENEQGEQLKFTLTYPSGSETYEKVVRFLRDNFAAGGVIMEVEPLKWPVLVDKLNRSDFDAVTLGWSASIEGDPYQIFHSSQIGDSGDNRTSYANKDLDALIDKARVTMDQDERMKLWHQVQAILHEDQPYTFMLNGKALRLMNDRIHNVEESSMGLNFESLNGAPLPWYVPTAEQ